MTIDRVVFAVAGAMILISLGLGLTTSPWFFLLTGFVGLNMFQAAFSGLCPLAMLLKALRVRPGAAFE